MEQPNTSEIMKHVDLKLNALKSASSSTAIKQKIEALPSLNLPAETKLGDKVIITTDNLETKVEALTTLDLNAATTIGNKVIISTDNLETKIEGLKTLNLDAATTIDGEPIATTYNDLSTATGLGVTSATGPGYLVVTGPGNYDIGGTTSVLCSLTTGTALWIAPGLKVTSTTSFDFYSAIYTV